MGGVPKPPQLAPLNVQEQWLYSEFFPSSQKLLLKSWVSFLPSIEAGNELQQSAHIPKEAERGPHDVIPLMEVYNKSLCKPRELLVEIIQEYPEEVEHIFIPSCVVLTRCAGCCSDEMLQCMPTSSYNVTMEIKRIKPQKQQNDIFMSFTEHSSCECRLKKEVKEQREKKPRQGKGKGLKRKRKKNREKTNHDAVCQPCCESCSDRRKRLFVQDPATCRCSCKHSDAYCKERQLELNERTCKCDKPR